MSNEQKKRSIEERCMKFAISDLSQLRGYKIDKSREKHGIEEERPDFILISPDNEKIGVEHFLVDTLFDTENIDNNIKYHSYSRQYPHKIDVLFKKYTNGKIVGNEQSALNDILEHIKTMLSYEHNFNSYEFSQYFLQTVASHALKISEYKAAKDGFGNNIARLGFICEIGITKNFDWDVLDSRGWHRQRINGIPMIEGLWMFIHILLQIGFIDFFIITTISAFDNKETHKSVYYDETTPVNIKTYQDFKYHALNIDADKKIINKGE